MTDDFQLFASAADGDAVHPDVALITAYLARELSLVQIVAVEDRLASDAAFLDAVTPILEAWSLADPSEFSRHAGSPSRDRHWVLSQSQRSDGWQRYLAEEASGARPSVGRVVAERGRPDRHRSVARIAAVIAVALLPLIGLAEVATVVVRRIENGRGPAVPSSSGTRGAKAPPPTSHDTLPPSSDNERGVEGRPQATLTRVALVQDSVPPTLRLVQELAIGGPAQPLTRIPTVRVGPHGQLLVPQPAPPVGRAGAGRAGAGRAGVVRAGPGNVLVFDSTGTLIRTLGLEAGGRGGIGDGKAVGWVGDSIWISGRGVQPTQLFAPSGAVIGTIDGNQAIPPAKDAARIPVLHFDGALATYPDRSMLVSASPDARDSLVLSGASGDGSRFVVVAPDGAIRRIVGDVVYGTTGVSYQMPGQFSYCFTSLPFRNEAAWAVSPDGSRIGTATANIRTHDGGDIRLTVVRSTGDTILAHSIPFLGIPIDSLQAQRALETQYARMASSPSPCGPAELANYRAKAPALVPPAMPPINGLVMGRDGTLWLDITVRGWSGTLVIDQKGAVIGRLRLPPGAILADAERGRAWVIEPMGDSWRVVQYRVQP